MRLCRPFLRGLCALFALLCLSPGGAAEPIALTAVSVDVLQSQKPAELKKLVPFTEGQSTSREEIEAILSELNALDIVTGADYELTPSPGGGYSLRVTLTEARVVRDIRVAGNYPFLNKQIQRLVLLQPGAPYDETLLGKSIENIDHFLVKNGYYHSKIAIERRPHPKFNTLDLVVRIKKGRTYRFGTITVSGNKAVSVRTIKNKITHWFRFKEGRLKTDLRRIRDHYAKLGFIKARIKLVSLTLDDASRKANIVVSIQENKRLRVSFDGKTGFNQGRLKRIVDFKTRRSYDRYTIEWGRKRLERFLRVNGYPEATVGAQTKKSDDEVNVTYSIQRGIGVALAKIKFEGNKTRASKTLKKHLLSKESHLLSRGKFQPKKLSQDARRLADYYREEGYLDIDVVGPEIETSRLGDQKKATFLITEGASYVIASVTAHSEDKYNLSALLKDSGLKEGKTLTAALLKKARVRMYDMVFADGYAYAKIQLTAKIDRDTHTAALRVLVDRGPKVRVRRIAITGNDVTKKKTILNNISIKEGQPFVYQKVLDAQLNLRRLGVFTTARVEPIGFDDKKTAIDLAVFVHEAKPITVSVQAGFDNRNLGRGEASFTKKNLFGLAKQFNARAIAGKKFNRGEVTFSSPRLWGANWNLSNQYFGQYEDAPNFDAYSFGGFVNTLKNFGPYWSFGFKEGITKTDVIESSSNVALLGDALFDNTFNTAGVFLSFDNRDNFSDPQKGVYALVREEINTDLSEFTNNFDTVVANVSQHQGFFGRFTLNNTVRYGQNFRIASRPRIPVNKLFFQGGSDTLRGFEEDGVDRAGGTVSFIYNAELHFKLMEGIKLAGFFDTGVLSDNVNTIVITDFRESAGIGLRYFTPVGPLRLDWGFILDRKPGEPTSRLHFSFGYFF